MATRRSGRAKKTPEPEPEPAPAPAKAAGKRKAAPAPAAAAAPSPAKKAGLSGAAAPAAVGVVDPGLAAIDPAVAAGARVAAGGFDARLAQVEPATNTDKYYVIQLLQTAEPAFRVFTRWGRTGTSGQGELSAPLEWDDAVDHFAAKFKDKTGYAWAQQARAVDAPIAGKYAQLAAPSDDAATDESLAKRARLETSASEVATADEGAAPEDSVAPMEEN